MNVYVAGSTKDIDNVRKAQRVCLSKGYDVTFDWTDPEHGKIRENWSPYRGEAQAHSSLERDAVRASDVVVLMWHGERAGTGSLIETGMAMGMGKRVIIVGDARESVFWYLPKVERVASLWGLAEVL